MDKRRKASREKREQDLRYKQIGARIRELRKQKGYDSYETFANVADISRSQVWRYENGESLNLTSLLTVIDALGVTLSEFFSEGF